MIAGQHADHGGAQRRLLPERRARAFLAGAAEGGIAEPAK